MVGVTGFEPAASTSQTSRATNCATPRCVKNIEFLRFFRKWSNLWSDRFFVFVLEKRMCEKVSIYKGFQAFGKPATESRLHAPKARALPTALHPEIFNFLFDLQLSAALPVATKALTALMACQSPSCRHSLLLAFSATGRARKRLLLQLRL